MIKRLTATLLMGLLLCSNVWAAETTVGKEMQGRLAELGYYSGGIDGVVGKGTASALIAFQKERGLEPTGRINSATLLSLFPRENRPSVVSGELPQIIIGETLTNIRNGLVAENARVFQGFAGKQEPPESDLSATFGETEGEATFTFKTGLQLTMTIDSTSETIAVDINKGRMIFHSRNENINVSNDFDISIDGTHYAYSYMRWVER